MNIKCRKDTFFLRRARISGIYSASYVIMIYVIIFIDQYLGIDHAVSFAIFIMASEITI